MLGAIFGGFLGSAVVLLFAPGSGNETRAALCEKYASMKVEFENAIAEKRAALESELLSYKNMK